MGHARSGGTRRSIRRGRQLPRLLIACEGDLEVAYFKGLGQCLRGKLAITAIQDRNHPGPEDVLALAIRHRDEERNRAADAGDRTDVFDAVWLVIDVDYNSGLADLLQHAFDEGIRVAISNPCFEVWLISHCELAAPFASPQAVKSRWKVLAGNHHDPVDGFAKLAGRSGTAINNAAILAHNHEAHGTARLERNPSSDVGTIIEAISAATGVDAAEIFPLAAR
jgi:hypothetical protein